MNEHPDQLTLQSYLDGEDLTALERQQIATHLHGCPECRELVEGDQQVQARVARLPAEIDPGMDLWPEIEAKIHASGSVRTPPTETNSFGKSRAATVRGWVWRGLAAGGAIAATLAIGIALGRQFSGLPMVSTAITGDSTIGGGLGAIVGTDSPAAAAIPAALRPPYDSSYQEQIAQLEALLLQSDGRLQPETIETVRENLEIIDQAIAASMEAISADPGNQRLQQHLANNMQKKLDLLRTATGTLNTEL